MLTMTSMVCVMMFYKTTPTKMSLFLVINSITVSMVSYSTTSSIFCMMSVVLSFSSGMMILFCYTTTLSAFESKYKSKMLMTTCMMLTTMIVSNYNMMTPSSQFNQGSMIMNTSMLLLMMVFIMSAMKAINQALINPSTKSLMTSF